MHTEWKKAALVDCGNVNAVDLYSMARSEWLDEIVLCGEGSQSLAERASMLLSLGAFPKVARLVVGELADAAKAEIAVIGSHIKRLENDRFIEQLQRTATIVRDAVRKLTDLGFKGIFLVTTAPVDVMTHFAAEELGRDTQRVMGLGTTPENTHQLGLEGSASSIWCSGIDSKAAFLDHCDPVCPRFDQAAHNSALLHQHGFKYAGNRLSGVATCVTRICKAILTNERTILPVSTMLNGEYDIRNLFITVPCVVGRLGVERIVKLPTTVDEKSRLREYSVELKTTIEELGPRVRAVAASVGQNTGGV